jgi:diacylglycerol kinase (ATP)
MEILKNIFKLRGLKESFSYAFKGIAYLFIYHRNMRIIFLAGISAFLLGIYFGLKGIELTILFITVTMVFMAEIFNTAIELMIDMISNKYHTMIKLVKDISAAVVLIASFNALAIGYILFVRKIFK